MTIDSYTREKRKSTAPRDTVHYKGHTQTCGEGGSSGPRKSNAYMRTRSTGRRSESLETTSKDLLEAMRTERWCGTDREENTSVTCGLAIDPTLHVANITTYDLD